MTRKGKQAEISSSFERIRYETPDKGIAKVVLARKDPPQNAQNLSMLYEIDRAFRIACADDDIKVIIIASEGSHFSTGHDFSDTASLSDFDTVSLQGGFEEPGQAGAMNAEAEVYLGFSLRWRSLPKPTIVQVHGKAVGGGLMLVWPFDIIMASEDATFADPVVALGVNGHEFFTHVWELGHRKAYEVLYTGAPLTAAECHQLGMVNHVVKREALDDDTLEMARRIAKRPAVGLRLAKMSVLQSLDAQGQTNAVRSAFGLHHFGHANARAQFGAPVDPAGIELIASDTRDERKGRKE